MLNRMRNIAGSYKPGHLHRPASLAMLLGLLAILVLLPGCSPSSHTPEASKGTLDLGRWDFEKGGMVKLNGEWEFYWNDLFTPADFKDSNRARKTDYIKVPLFWDHQEIDSKRLPVQGFATYRLRVKMPPGQRIMGIKLPDANSASRVWINGDLVAEVGRVGRSAKEERPDLLPVVRLFDAPGDLEIVIQVSNHFIHRSGVWQSISLGTQEMVFRERDSAMVLNLALVGTFIILSIYNLFIFFLRRTEYTAVLFSMVSLCFGIRTLTIDDRPILLLFPKLDVNILYRMQYESLLAACVFFCAFVYSLFPREFSRKVLNILIWVSIAEFAIVVFTPTMFYTSLLDVVEVKLFLECFFCSYVVAKSAIKGLRRALPLCFVMVMLFAAGVNDALYTHFLADTGYMMQYAAFFLMLVQAYIVATRISGAYFKFSNLTMQLNAANVNLEQKVAERTQELESEKKKADDLLLNILPAETARELKVSGRSVARTYRMVTVMLIDMVGFTKISEQIGAELLVSEIDECFKAFDAIVEEYGVEKIKTIGDAYLCAGGLPNPNDTHAEDVINAAFKMNEFMRLRILEKEQKGEISFQVRIGINSGPVVAGIVGAKKFAYDIWGDAVKLAGDMEHNCDPGRINVSTHTYELVKNKFDCIRHEGRSADGMSAIDMYYIAGVKTTTFAL